MKCALLAMISALVSITLPAFAATRLEPPSEVVELPAIQPFAQADLSQAVFIHRFASGPLREPVQISSSAELETLFGALGDSSEQERSAALQIAQYFTQGGSRAWILRTPELVPSKEDFQALLPVAHRLGALVIPALSYLPVEESRPAYAAAVEFVKINGGFLIADPVATAKTPREVLDWTENVPELASKHVAVYFPRIQVPGPQGPEFIGPSGAMAGVFARVDQARGVWKAPANEELRGTSTLEYPLSRQEEESLSRPLSGRAINPIRSFSGRGIRVWGARTQKGEDNEFRYISVTRSHLMLERSLKAGVSQFKGYPNDETTWSQIAAQTSDFMMRLWREGALQGAKPEQAFGVYIGPSMTMGEDDIAEGRLRIVVGAAWVRPAEWIMVWVEQKQEI